MTKPRGSRATWLWLAITAPLAVGLFVGSLVWASATAGIAMQAVTNQSSTASK